jgi:hypothetical protein
MKQFSRGITCDVPSRPPAELESLAAEFRQLGSR